MLVVAEDAPRLQGAGVLLAPTCRVPQAGVGEGNAPLPAAGRALPAPPRAAQTSGQRLRLNQFGKLVFRPCHGREPGQPLWSIQISYKLLRRRSARRCCQRWLSPFPGDKEHLPDFASVCAFPLEKPQEPTCQTPTGPAPPREGLPGGIYADEVG